MLPWWNNKDADPTIGFRYATYEIDGMTIHVGNRPRKAIATEVVCNEDFFNKINAWVSVTDTETLIPPRTNYFWFPWWEPEVPHEALVKGFIATMNQLQKRGGQTVYLHCDAGTHRSPSMLGFWLTHLGVEDIAPTSSCGYHNPNQISKPLEYAKSYFKRHPEIKIWAVGC